MSETIHITFNPDGTTEIRTTGFRGKSCMKAAEFLKKTLGSVLKTKKTAEYFQRAAASDRQRKGGPPDADDRDRAHPRDRLDRVVDPGNRPGHLRALRQMTRLGKRGTAPGMRERKPLVRLTSSFFGKETAHDYWNAHRSREHAVPAFLNATRGFQADRNPQLITQPRPESLLLTASFSC